jgi:hypothetical protein
MKKDNRINPLGLKGNAINERMIQLMGIKPINENHSKSVVELTKIGPDGKAYAIVRENHECYIKLADKTSNLVAEDFKYIGGLQNKKSEAYPSYAKAIKHLNLRFNSLAESLDKGHNINVFENDNLLAESGNGFGGGFADMPKGGGFTGEGNLEGNTPLWEESINESDYEGKESNCCGAPFKYGDICSACNEHAEPEEEEDELTEEEKAVDAMLEGDLVGDQDKMDVEPEGGDGDIDGKDLAKLRKDDVNEHKLSILKAMKNMDAIIDTLSEGKVKKKVYTIK